MKEKNDIKIETLAWEDFVERVKNEHIYRPTKTEKLNLFMIRCFIIKKTKELFKSIPHFSDMKPDDRKFIAGIPNELETQEMITLLEKAGKPAFESHGSIRYRYTRTGRLMTAGTYIATCFGNMAGCGIFKQKICENNKNISFALDQIPISGEITREYYSNYWKYFEKEFKETYIATATRLLCMKRPDFFLCFDSANKEKLCDAFNLSKSKRFNKDNYWENILSRIFKSDWYKNSNMNFKDDEEKLIYGAKVAFLDALYYETTNNEENERRRKGNEF
jgi:hypothetical protein